MQKSEINKKSIRVLVVDDNMQMRHKVVQLLKPDFEVVGTAADGKSALDLVMVLKPEIVVLDISMPILSGIEVASEMKQNESEAKIVFLTVHEDPDFVKAALNVGASGYVIKSQMAMDLLSAMRAASEGHAFVSPSCALTVD